MKIGKMFSNLKLRNKLLLAIIPIVIVLYGITIVFVYSSADKNLEELARANSKSVASKYGNFVKGEILSKLQIARDLAIIGKKIEVLSPEIRRNVISNILKKTLEENNDLFGTWTVWEPNALDGKDNEFKSTPGSDASGRYVPYWNKAGGINLDVCVDYDKSDAAGDYYNRPKKEQKEIIMEPFEYPVAGQKVQMVSLCVPIIVNNQVKGVAGVDLAMDKFQKLIDSLKIYETGYAILIAQNAAYVAHPKKEVVGKLYGTGQKIEDIDKIIADLKAGREFEIVKKI